MEQHLENCTPDCPCDKCQAHANPAAFLRKRWLEKQTKKAAAKIDGFFAIAGADAIKGFYARTPVEVVEDEMISPNPLG